MATKRQRWLALYDVVSSDLFLDGDESNDQSMDSDEEVDTHAKTNGTTDGGGVAYNLNVEKWRRHVQHMAEGMVKLNSRGHYVVEKLQSVGKEPEIEFITSVERDVDLARSVLGMKPRKRK